MADKLDGLIISEILADNAGGNAVDVDGDGNTNKADEFIEIQSTNGTPLSLDGYELWSSKEGLLYSFGSSDVIGAGQTATVVGNYTGTPPAGYYNAGAAENSNWLPDGEGQKFDSIFLVNSTTGDYVVLSYGNPPPTPVAPSGFPGTNLIGNGEVIDSNAPNGTAFARDADGDFTETTPTPDTPGVTCFVAGTLIETEDGPLPVCALRPGMRLATRDNGWQPLCARRETTVTPAMMHIFPMLRPVRIPRGVFGATRPLDVSAAHNLLWFHSQAELLFESREVFVSARNLMGYGAIWSPLADHAVIYHHLLLPQHEVIMAHGVWSESLFMGDVARHGRRALGQWHIDENIALRDITHRHTARPVLRRYEIDVLLGTPAARAA